VFATKDKSRGNTQGNEEKKDQGSIHAQKQAAPTGI